MVGYKMHSHIHAFKLNLSTLVLVLFCHQVAAAEIIGTVTDAKGHALSDAVVYLEGHQTAMPSNVVKADIAQKSKQFNPLVTVIQTGSSINFPNQDSVRHHVYSFSPAKKFELKLYSGVPASPVVFDKAGTVVLGCNIHDTMLAFVYIVDTPFFAKTDKSGQIKLSNVPEGSYTLKAWHYALQKENTPVEKRIDVKSDQKISLSLEINDASLVQGR
jgi:plastocyanin